MADKLMYIQNDDTQNYPFCRLQFIVEPFERSNLWTRQSKFNKIPKYGMLTIKKFVL